MQMMRKFYMLAAMTAVMAVSCKRASVSDDLPVIPQGSPLTVEASLDAAVTRTTLDPTDGLTLLWEAGDQLAVYSSFIGNETSYRQSGRYNDLRNAMANAGLSEAQIEGWSSFLYWIESASLYPSYQKNGILTVTDASAGSANGQFKSTNSAFEWFGNGTSASDEKYWFTAYYPAPSQEFLDAHPIQNIFCSGADALEGLSLRMPWVMVNIPSVQDGKSWSRYQLVVCSGFDYLGFEADDTHVPDMGGVVTQQGVLEGTEKVRFASFQPLTALLHFYLKVESTAAADQYDISKIVISQEASWNGARRSDLYALSGEVPYFMICNAPNRDEDTTLWNRYCAPYYVGNTLFQSPVGTSWEHSAGLCNTITLQFSEPYPTVTKQGTGEEFYAVAIPTNASPSGSDYKNPALIFEAYDASGNMILSSRMLTPNRIDFEEGRDWGYGTGLEYGHKYDFTVTLKPILTGNGDTAGKYDVITEW